MDMKDSLTASLNKNINFFLLQSGNSERLIINRLYKEILERDPDPDGIHEGFRLLSHEKIPLAKYCEILTDSEEYRIKNRPSKSSFQSTVCSIYEDILHRNADSDGLTYYTQMLSQNKITPTMLRCILRFSREGMFVGEKLSMSCILKGAFQFLLHPGIVFNLFKKPRGSK